MWNLLCRGWWTFFPKRDYEPLLTIKHQLLLHYTAVACQIDSSLHLKKQSSNRIKHKPPDNNWMMVCANLSVVWKPPFSSGSALKLQLHSGESCMEQARERSGAGRFFHRNISLARQTCRSSTRCLSHLFLQTSPDLAPKWGTFGSHHCSPTQMGAPLLITSRQPVTRWEQLRATVLAPVPGFYDPTEHATAYLMYRGKADAREHTGTAKRWDENILHATFYRKLLMPLIQWPIPVSYFSDTSKPLYAYVQVTYQMLPLPGICRKCICCRPHSALQHPQPSGEREFWEQILTGDNRI